MDPTPPPPERAPAERPGARLRAAREARGMNIQDVISSLNLREAIVVALEADRYERLPASPTYVRGYIRAYARLLRIDPEPLLEAYSHNAAATLPPILPTRRREIRPQPTMDSRPIKLISAIVTVTVLGLGIVWWKTQHQRKADADQSQSTATVEATATPTPPPTAERAELHDLQADLKQFSAGILGNDETRKPEEAAPAPALPLAPPAPDPPLGQARMGGPTDATIRGADPAGTDGPPSATPLPAFHPSPARPPPPARPPAAQPPLGGAAPAAHAAPASPGVTPHPGTAPPQSAPGIRDSWPPPPESPAERLDGKRSAPKDQITGKPALLQAEPLPGTASQPLAAPERPAAAKPTATTRAAKRRAREDAKAKELAREKDQPKAKPVEPASRAEKPAPTVNGLPIPRSFEPLPEFPKDHKAKGQGFEEHWPSD